MPEYQLITIGYLMGLMSVLPLTIWVRSVMKENADLRDRFMSKSYAEYTDGVVKKTVIVGEPETLVDGEGEEQSDTLPVG